MTILGALLAAAEQGRFPPADMGVTHVPQPTARHGAVLGFTGHIVVSADVPASWLAAALPPGDPGAAFNPPFLGALEAQLHKRVSNIDAMLIGAPLPGPPPVSLALVEDQDHPRVRRAQRYRDDVRVWTCAGGVVTIGRGLAGRWELGFEVDPAARGRGLGRALAISARHLVNELAGGADDDDRADPAHQAAPGGPAPLAPVRPLWAQVAVGNAASLRAVLAAGYRPVGQEAMLVPERLG